MAMSAARCFPVVLSLLAAACHMEEPAFSGVLKGGGGGTGPGSDVPVAVEILSVSDAGRVLQWQSGGFRYRLAPDLSYPSGSGISMQAVFPDGSVARSEAGGASFSALLDSPGIQSVTLTLGGRTNPVQDSYSVVVYDSECFVPVLSASGNLSSFADALDSEGRLGFVLESGSFSAGPFSISSTEVSYARWRDVYEWATSTERGQDAYVFRNAGSAGASASPGEAATSSNGDLPVTGVSLCDVKVWCNAASEMAGLEPVYRNADGTVLRDSGETARIVACTARNTGGYRLPTAGEWELAGRGGLVGYGAHLAYAEGKLPGIQAGLTFDVTEEVWQMEWAGAADRILAEDFVVSDVERAAMCGSRRGNLLALFDMGGNVAEWVDSRPDGSSAAEPRFYALGGSWYDSLETCRLQDRSVSYHPAAYNEYTGFRLCKSLAGQP